MPQARTDFTESDDNYLLAYFAAHNPDKAGRSGKKVYENMCNNTEERPWTARHPWQSWRERYVKNQDYFDYYIKKKVKNIAAGKDKEEVLEDLEEEKVNEDGKLIEHFTADEKRLLTKFLATYSSKQSRNRVGVYVAMVEDKEGKWSWAKNHSPASWLGLYRLIRSDMDRKIEAYQIKHHITVRPPVSLPRKNSIPSSRGASNIQTQTPRTAEGSRPNTRVMQSAEKGVQTSGTDEESTGEDDEDEQDEEENADDQESGSEEDQLSGDDADGGVNSEEGEEEGQEMFNDEDQKSLRTSQRRSKPLTAEHHPSHADVPENGQSPTSRTLPTELQTKKRRRTPSPPPAQETHPQRNRSPNKAATITNHVPPMSSQSRAADGQPHRKVLRIRKEGPFGNNAFAKRLWESDSSSSDDDDEPRASQSNTSKMLDFRSPIPPKSSATTTGGMKKSGSISQLPSSQTASQDRSNAHLTETTITGIRKHPMDWLLGDEGALVAETTTTVVNQEPPESVLQDGMIVDEEEEEEEEPTLSLNPEDIISFTQVEPEEPFTHTVITSVEKVIETNTQEEDERSPLSDQQRETAQPDQPLPSSSHPAKADDPPPQPTNTTPHPLPSPPPRARNQRIRSTVKKPGTDITTASNEDDLFKPIPFPPLTHGSAASSSADDSARSSPSASHLLRRHSIAAGMNMNTTRASQSLLDEPAGRQRGDSSLPQSLDNSPTSAIQKKMFHRPRHSSSLRNSTSLPIPPPPPPKPAPHESTPNSKHADGRIAMYLLVDDDETAEEAMLYKKLGKRLFEQVAKQYGFHGSVVRGVFEETGEDWDEMKRRLVRMNRGAREVTDSDGEDEGGRDGDILREEDV